MTKAAVDQFINERFRIAIKSTVNAGKSVGLYTIGQPVASRALPLHEQIIYYFHEGIPKEDYLKGALKIVGEDREYALKALFKHLSPFKDTMVLSNGGQPTRTVTAWFRHNTKGRVLIMPINGMTFAGFEDKADFVKARLTWKDG
jgi:hypothetical protein